MTVGEALLCRNEVLDRMQATVLDCCCVFVVDKLSQCMSHNIYFVRQTFVQCDQELIGGKKKIAKA